MKFTLFWLKSHLETAASLEEITATLNKIGWVVADVKDQRSLLKPFLIAEILETSPHPKADRLQICVVNDGTQRLQVVCGAPNARAGLKVVLAPIGAVIPSTGEALKKGIIREVESFGMLCSAAELLLNSAAEGILELPASSPVGAPFAETLGYDDPVIEIEVTSNRGDCLSVRGIARELAAAGLGQLKPLTLPDDGGAVIKESSGSSGLKIQVDPSMKAHGCWRVIRGLQNTQSPDWMQQRLQGIGVSIISTVVDITNYVCFDLGRSMHAFDAQRLQGNIHVRHAKASEKFLDLKEHTHSLSSTHGVIADDTGVVALAGVMGGLSTGCTSATTDIVLECAFFDPIDVAMAGRSLGIHSDSRQRFERFVDPVPVRRDLDYATALILKYCGGEAESVIQAGIPPALPQGILFSLEKIESLIGLTVPEETCVKILESLGCSCKKIKSGCYDVTPPTWRSDMTLDVDLIEEIIRINGYEHIPNTPLPPVPAGVLSPSQKRREILRKLLASRGLQEAVTWSFISVEMATLFGKDPETLKLMNPMSPELAIMRPTLLVHLLDAITRNHERGQTDRAFFEIGPQYQGIMPEDQAMMIAGVRSGMVNRGSWLEKSRPVDIFDIKSDVFSVLEAWGIDPEAVQIGTDVPSWYHPGRAGVLRLGPQKILGYFGEIHPYVQHVLCKQGAVGFEIFLDQLPPPKERKVKSSFSVSPYQAVERDFSFVVNTEIPADKVIKAVAKVDRDLIKSVTIFDVFALPPTEESSQVALGVRVRLEPRDKTLTEQDITSLMTKIIQQVKDTTGGVLRS